VGDKEAARGIFELSKEVGDYAQFRGVLELGLQVHYSDLPFEKVMLYSWIKEAIEDGRKN
jgi:hypothetical protein